MLATTHGYMNVSKFTYIRRASRQVLWREGLVGDQANVHLTIGASDACCLTVRPRARVTHCLAVVVATACQQCVRPGWA